MQQRGTTSAILGLISVIKLVLCVEHECNAMGRTHCSTGDWPWTCDYYYSDVNKSLADANSRNALSTDKTARICLHYEVVIEPGNPFEATLAAGSSIFAKDGCIYSDSLSLDENAAITLGYNAYLGGDRYVLKRNAKIDLADWAGVYSGRKLQFTMEENSLFEGYGFRFNIRGYPGVQWREIPLV
jgi:hypothetical protein